MRTTRIPAWTLGLMLVGPGGCVSPTDPPPPPGGGQEYELSFDGFQQTVAPVLADLGCHTAECHGGGIRGTFELSPVEAPDPAFDFEQTRLQVNGWDPPNSPILLKPLSVDAGGELHSHEPFASTDDPRYVAILDWILAGDFR